ncbi:carotenoid oxygenase family protein [Paraliomyxa miuraensis]|uniref:carotenoid oxygenase family protein n=1 Tax=Paraliomyxa miuraensis TaxID=376150 RepID=UPI00225A4808|nr:carotenoid oxygenase family protein [Paraliomyxa miuraensis]MCX4247508.1 carotenoid oxygenase family protein [Paraliomyxa miuraensis]
MPFDSLHENLRTAHGFVPLELEGTVPEDLRGTLYRAGPGMFERFGVAVAHPFEADGAITAVRFGDERPLGAARIIESEGYLEEQSAGRRLYGTGAGRLRNIVAALRQRTKNTANTSAWVHDGQVYALMEGARPTRLHPDTLDVLGEERFDGTLRGVFSAHPHRVAALGTTFNFGVRYGREHALDLYALPDHGPTRHLGVVPLPWAGMVHDFIATERHLVFVVGPVRLLIWRALLGDPNFERLFAWEPERGTEIIVVPLAEPERVIRIPAEPFWVWHFANAFERGDEIVVDLCRYADFGTLREIRTGRGGQPAAATEPRYHRARLDVRTRRMTSEERSPCAAEFPRVHPEREGVEHRLAFLHGGKADGSEVVTLLEVETGRTSSWQPDTPTALSEPIPVARGNRPDDERDAWVLVLGYEQARDRSFVAVLDGDDLSQGPVARAWFDHPIPITFHGAFAPAS